MTRSRPEKRSRAATSSDDAAAAPSGRAKAARRSLDHTAAGQQQQQQQRAALVDISNNNNGRRINGAPSNDHPVKERPATRVDMEDVVKVVTRAQRAAAGKENGRVAEADAAVRKSTSLKGSSRTTRSHELNSSQSRITTRSSSDASAHHADDQRAEDEIEDANNEQEDDEDDDGLDGEEEEEEEEDEEEEDGDERAEYIDAEDEADHDDGADDQQEKIDDDVGADNEPSAIAAVQLSHLPPAAQPQAALTVPSAAAPPSSSSSSSSSPSSTMYTAPQRSPSEVAAALSAWKASVAASRAAGSSHEYGPSILEHLRVSEVASLPPASYMDDVQGDLSYPMRSILLDWLVEVAAEYHLQAQTLFLCVSYVDRFLARTPIDRKRLQLVGITCMLVAAKYWELYPPTIEDFVYISDHTYDREQVLDMERVVLTALRFQLTTPTCWEFGRRLSRECGMEQIEANLMDFLMEAYTQEPAYLHHRPSVVAASAAYLSMTTLNVHTAQPGGGGKPRKPLRAAGDVIRIVRQHSGYEYKDLKACVVSMHALHERLVLDPNGTVAAGSTGFKAVADKYSVPTKHHVSRVQPRTSIAEIR